jgi:hypothetical protein
LFAFPRGGFLFPPKRCAWWPEHKRFPASIYYFWVESTNYWFSGALNDRHATEKHTARHTITSVPTSAGRAEMRTLYWKWSSQLVFLLVDCFCVR